MPTPRIAFFLLLILALTRPAAAQNPVQWSGNVSNAVSRAAEQSLPLLFWVTESEDDSDDDLSDAQSHSFRDPGVVRIIRSRFVPVRVGRTSKVLKEAERLGLPTSHGLYCAVLTHDGRLLDQMGPGEIADPVAFAAHLESAFERHCDDLLQKEILPILNDPEATKARVRLAARTVWRLNIRKADKEVIRILDRTDLTPSERSRLYELLAALGTQNCIAALLDRADDKAAAAALQKADAAALEWLTPELPKDDAEITDRQLTAYLATARVCRMTATKPKEWWSKASQTERRKELDRVTAKAEAVLEFSRESQR